MRFRLGCSLVALLVLAAACGGSGETSEGGGTPAEAACPSALVIQTDWWPEVEHGGAYQLIGPGGTVSSDQFTYTGPIQEKYAVAGIETVEIRAGGDAIAFTPALSVLRTDDSVYMAFVNLSEVIATPGIPAIGVAGTLDISPQHIQWDPARYDFSLENPEALGESGLPLLHFDTDVFPEFLVGKGIVNEGQLDGSYSGAPDRSVAADGDILQQGFTTNEIFKYENEIEGWKKPVDYLLLHDLGYVDYPAMYAVEADELEAKSPCLEQLVPVLQQAWVDFLEEPGPTGDQITQINGDFATYWTVSSELNRRALELMETTGIGGNGTDSTYGNFDLTRVQELIDITAPIFRGRGIAVAPELAPADVVTNQFIDAAISGPFGQQPG